MTISIVPVGGAEGVVILPLIAPGCKVVQGSGVPKTHVKAGEGVRRAVIDAELDVGLALGACNLGS